MTIEEIRLLPPLAIGRLGAAAQPMDNYDAEVDPERPLAHRRLRPAETLEVDTGTGEIVRAFVPDELRFTENGQPRPVAPFLELWALTGRGVLEPLTTEVLASAGASPADVRWRVHVGNHKVFRRTGARGDRIEARTEEFSDHVRRPLEGNCRHFWPGRRLPLGHVQYIKPTPDFPGIRLRFTPAAGLVYGSSKTRPRSGRPEDPNIVEVLYDANKGRWQGYYDQGKPIETIPGAIYANDEDAKGNPVSRGYLDDECDGLVHVELTAGGRNLASYARIGAGPPAYAPDSFPMRTVADELEQALLGFQARPSQASMDRVEEIIRRAFETVRLMNTIVMNGNTIDGRTGVASTMIAQDTVDTGRYYEPIMAPSLVDNLALENLHQSVVTALRGGTAPWFADVLRDYDEIGDLSAKGRRKMPAMMRGADGRYLTLTRRQVNLIRAVAKRAIFPPPEERP